MLVLKWINNAFQWCIQERLLEEMEKHEHELMEEEKDINRHGPHHLYTTDTSNCHTYRSPFQQTKPDINNCIAKWVQDSFF